MEDVTAATKEDDFVQVEPPAAVDDEASAASLKDQIRVVHYDGDNDDVPDTDTPAPLSGADMPQEPHPVQVALVQAAETTKTAVGKVVKDVQGWSDENLVPHVESVKTNTSKTFSALGESTKKNVDTHVAPHVQSLKANTSKTMQHITTSTRSIVDDHVVPNYESIKTNTSKTVEQISTSTREAYVEKVHPRVMSFRETCMTYAPYYMGTAPALFETTEAVWYMHPLVEASCRSHGQVAFCNNPVTGVLLWLAILCASPLAAMCALVCVVSANASAWYLEMDTVLLRKGIFAYNAVLVGCGIATYLVFEWGFVLSLLLSILSGPLVVLAYLYTASKVTWPLHLPANAVLMVQLLSAVVWESTVIVVEEEMGGFLANLFVGISQMFLVRGAFSGFLILIGLALCSRILAAAAFCGSLLGLVVPLFGAGGGANVALTGVALLYFVAPTPKAIAVAMLGGLLTLFVHSAVEGLFAILTLPMATMTIPFCLSTLPILVALDGGTTLGGTTVELIPPGELSTPEEYLVAHAPPSEAEMGDKTTSGNTLASEDEPLTEETPLMSAVNPEEEGETTIV